MPRLTHDRDFYRAMTAASLLNYARERGLNPELAIAMAEKLGEINNPFRGWRGVFTFNEGAETDA